MSCAESPDYVAGWSLPSRVRWSDQEGRGAAYTAVFRRPGP